MLSHLKATFAERILLVQELIKKTNKSSVLIIQQFPVSTDTLTKLPKVRESISNILAFVELGEPEVLQEIITMADGVFDAIAFDSDIKLPLSSELLQIAEKHIKQSKLFFYSDINTWADSAIQFVLQQEKGLYGKSVLLAGEGALYDAVLHRINYLGASIVTDTSVAIDVVIGCALKSTSVDESIMNRLGLKPTLYDIGIGNFTLGLIEAAHSKAYPIYRIDIRAGISSLVINLLETDYLINKVMGRAKIKDVELVAGGMMGKKNAVIIDDINFPSSIIGVADGRGNVKIDLAEEDHTNIAFVERLIATL